MWVNDNRLGKRQEGSCGVSNANLGSSPVWRNYLEDVSQFWGCADNKNQLQDGAGARGMRIGVNP